MIARNASSRSCSTTLPTTRALNHERKKLNTHAETPVSRMAANQIHWVRRSNVSAVIRSSPQAAAIGVSIEATEFSTIIDVVMIIAVFSGRK